MLKYLRTIAESFLPQHTLSRLVGLIAESTNPRIKNLLITQFLKHYTVDLSIASIEDPYAYSTFNQFFTRKLKVESRPINMQEDIVVSPVDGFITQMGRIKQNQLIQAKNFYFDLETLLGGDQNLAKVFYDQYFATFYLAPYQYHRIHMPLAGQLEKTIYIPGKLFSVNSRNMCSISNLYSRNERLVTVFKTEAGPLAVILVGALLVGNIQTVWQAQPTHTSKLLAEDYTNLDPVYLAKGEELGQFKMGSTVILLLANENLTWIQDLKGGSLVKFGQSLAVLNLNNS